MFISVLLLCQLQSQSLNSKLERNLDRNEKVIKKQLSADEYTSIIHNDFYVSVYSNLDNKRYLSLVSTKGTILETYKVGSEPILITDFFKQK